MRISSRITALKYKCLYNSLLYINRNNAETKRYQEEGLKLLSGKVDSLPSKIAFRPKFIKQSSCIKVFDKLGLFSDIETEDKFEQHNAESDEDEEEDEL